MNMISLLKLLFEEDTTTSDTGSSTVDKNIEGFEKEITTRLDAIDKTLLAAQKASGGAPQQTQTKADASTGTTKTTKTMPATAAGRQAPVGTSKSQQPSDVVTSKELQTSLDQLKKDLTGAIEQSSSEK